MCIRCPQLEPSDLAGCMRVSIPWDRAETVRMRLAEQGIAATAYYEPWERTAAIEIPPGVRPEVVLAVLEEGPASLVA